MNDASNATTESGAPGAVGHPAGHEAGHQPAAGADSSAALGRGHLLEYNEADYVIGLPTGTILKSRDNAKILFISAEPKTAPDKPNTDGWEWAIVEIFGHRSHAGRIREEERFGAKMMRVDVPVKGDPEKNGWETHWYGGSSIFSLMLTDEATALRANKPYEPPSRVSLPAPSRDDGFDGGHDDHDE